MKKFLFGLVVAIGLGVVAFLFLKDYLAKADVEKRVERLFDMSNGLRTGFTTRDSDLLLFFDMEKYDPQAPRPEEWVAQWSWENKVPDFERTVAELKVLEHTESDAYVEFTAQEGIKGDSAKGIPSDMKSFSYEVRLVYDTSGSQWKVKSLKRKGS